jgi:hypothetical protein
MSGTKVVSVTAGAASSASGVAALGLAALAPAAGVVLATGAVVVAGVAVAQMAKGAFDAYQTRLRQEQEKAEQREQSVQERIAQIRSQIRHRQPKVSLNIPHLTSSPSIQTNTTSTPNTPTSVVEPDNHKKIQEQKARLPKIRSEYQALIEQQILDEQTVNEGLKQTEQALNANNLEKAIAHLRDLDDDRIAAIKGLESAWQQQLDYVQERLDELKKRLPVAVNHKIQNQINQARSNWQNLTDEVLQSFHQQISELAAQAERIEIAAQNMIAAWHQVGYAAEFVGFDNGDALIESDTHEGAKTLTRIQFDGQQMQLKAPSDEPEMSCAARTAEALQLFEEQGYHLEWESWDGEPVTEEWREIDQSSEISQDGTEDYPSNSSSRRLQQQEH